MATTFLTWVPSPETKSGLTLALVPLQDCPLCHTPAGHLFHDEDTPEGACLSCKVQDDLIERYEAEEAERAQAPDMWDMADEAYDRWVDRQFEAHW